MSSNSHMPRNFGFSLVELMLVVTVVGILLSLATPGYRSFVMRAHRTEAIGKLLQVAACQERIFAARRFYDTGQCLPDANNNYALDYAVPGVSDADGFTIIATPLGTQSEDYCGALSLDQTGSRAVGNVSANSVKCWSGR